MPVRYPQPEVRFVGTGGVVADPDRARELRERQLMPPTGRVWPRRLVLDLSGGADFTPAALEELIVPLGERFLSGAAGDVAGIVFATPDPALRRAIVALANRHGFPFFVARSFRPEDVRDALPAAELSPADTETLEELTRQGGHATAVDLANQLSLEPTAVTNRLTNLTRRGLVYRVERNRRQGAEYVDPRHLETKVFLTHAMRPPPGSALRAAGIHSDPYDTSPLKVEGEAAERAAEILRRRGGGS
jgi:DNA-binding transcriptional ArsR family regulator